MIDKTNIDKYLLKNNKYRMIFEKYFLIIDFEESQ